MASALQKGQIPGGVVVVEKVDVAEVAGASATANLTVNGADGLIVGPDGKAIETVEGEGEVRRALLLTKTGGRWLVSGILALNG